MRIDINVILHPSINIYPVGATYLIEISSYRDLRVKVMSHTAEKRDAQLKNIIIRNVHESEALLISQLALRSKAHWGYSDSFMAQCEAELSYSASHISDPFFIFKAAQKIDDASNTIIGFYALKRIDLTSFELEALFVDTSLHKVHETNQLLPAERVV